MTRTTHFLEVRIIVILPELLLEFIFNIFILDRAKSIKTKECRENIAQSMINPASTSTGKKLT